MFDALSERLGGIFDNLTGRGALSEKDVSEALREIRVALLEADVALPVVKDFIAKGNVDQMPSNAIHDPNNLLMQASDGTFREAAAGAGVATAEDIDTGMRLGANHPMGPLELSDFIGLDTCLSIMQVLYDGLADSKYRPCPLLVKYVEAGWLGRKTQRGFYDYRGETPVPTR